MSSGGSVCAGRVSSKRGQTWYSIFCILRLKKFLSIDSYGTGLLIEMKETRCLAFLS